MILFVPLMILGMMINCLEMSYNTSCKPISRLIRCQCMVLSIYLIIIWPVLGFKSYDDCRTLPMINFILPILENTFNLALTAAGCDFFLFKWKPDILINILLYNKCILFYVTSDINWQLKKKPRLLLQSVFSTPPPLFALNARTWGGSELGHLWTSLIE